MRFGITGLVFALLMTGALDAEEVSVRRVVSHALPSDMEKRILSSASSLEIRPPGRIRHPDLIRRLRWNQCLSTRSDREVEARNLPL